MDITISRRRENYSRWNDVFCLCLRHRFLHYRPMLLSLVLLIRLDIWKGLFCLEGFLKVVNYFPFFHVDIKEKEWNHKPAKTKTWQHDTRDLLLACIAVAPRIPETLWNHIYYYYIIVCAENTLVYIKGVHFLKKVPAMFFWISSLVHYFIIFHLKYTIQGKITIN